MILSDHWNRMYDKALLLFFKFYFNIFIVVVVGQLGIVMFGFSCGPTNYLFATLMLQHNSEKFFRNGLNSDWISTSTICRKPPLSSLLTAGSAFPISLTCARRIYECLKNWIMQSVHRLFLLSCWRVFFSAKRSCQNALWV